jgi:hypothetical protein
LEAGFDYIPTGYRAGIAAHVAFAAASEYADRGWQKHRGLHKSAARQRVLDHLAYLSADVLEEQRISSIWCRLQSQNEPTRLVRTFSVKYTRFIGTAIETRPDAPRPDND